MSYAVLMFEMHEISLRDICLISYYAEEKTTYMGGIFVFANSTAVAMMRK